MYSENDDFIVSSHALKLPKKKIRGRIRCPRKLLLASHRLKLFCKHSHCQFYFMTYSMAHCAITIFFFTSQTLKTLIIKRAQNLRVGKLLSFALSFHFEFQQKLRKKKSSNRNKKCVWPTLTIKRAKNTSKAIYESHTNARKSETLRKSIALRRWIKHETSSSFTSFRGAENVERTKQRTLSFFLINQTKQANIPTRNVNTPWRRKAKLAQSERLWKKKWKTIARGSLAKCQTIESKWNEK